MTERDAEKREDPVVFRILRDSKCEVCGDDLPAGSMLTKQGEKGLCLSCADMDHLAYLPAGNAALTRRSRKHSTLSAVVVKWSRARKRYERRGILVEEEALDKAEEECLADAELRETRRIRNMFRLAELDAKYVEQFANEIKRHYPGCPTDQATRIAEHACRKHSGRVGRSAAAKEFDEEAIRLAVRAAIRHNHTRYDELLMRGWDRYEAREEVAHKVEEIERRWEKTWA